MTSGSERRSAAIVRVVSSPSSGIPSVLQGKCPGAVQIETWGTGLGCSWGNGSQVSHHAARRVATA